ncbi:MAG TPA: adenylate/guanylate cyclase domain-containing protein [Candidatus Limnocylindrales bacterium]
MVDDARPDVAASAYRAFLFTDVRDFTAFAERQGNAAAADMVGRFLEIARRAIARHDGAEIKTEGDAIHAVFQSASSAALCGLEIVEAAAESNAREPDRPLRIGVGVHAGEAVETAEGYIGRAVNIAARLCAAAQPGEVLVSSTVKGITQASISVGFKPRGWRRLKGIEDPILVYAVTRDAHARVPNVVSRSSAAVGGVAIAAVAISVVFLLAGPQLGRPAASVPAATLSTKASATAAPAVTRTPVVMGPLSIGTYATSEFQPTVAFDVADQGWVANRDAPEIFGVIRDSSPRGGVQFLRVQEVFPNACIAGSEASPGPVLADPLAALEGLDHLTLQDPRQTTVGGFDARQVDVVVSDGALAACGGLVGTDVPIFRAGDEVWGATPGERFRVVAVDVGDEVVTMVLSTDWTETPAVQELEDLLVVGGRLLDSVRF